MDYSNCSGLIFHTAWQEPSPVIQKLSVMYPDIEFVHKWSEEQMNVYCGTAKYLAGVQTEYELMQDPAEMMNFSKEIWLQLNQNGTSFEQGQTM